VTQEIDALAGFDATEVSIVDAVRRFVTEAVRPNVARLEREGAYPEQLVAGMRDLGLFGIAAAEAHGGLALRLPVFAAVMEELAKGWTTLAAYVNSHSTVAYAIGRHGTAAQQAKYLPMMASGALRGALCLTEPGTGSDLQAIRAVAKPSSSGYELSGTKFFVTNGERAGLLLVLAKTDPTAQPAKKGISLLLVEKASSGVKQGSTFHKMAYGHVDTVEIVLDGSTVPSSALLGEAPGRGLQQLFDGLEVGRIAIAASAVGLAADALNEAKRYASVREAFGTTIDQHQAVQLKLAEMATKLVAARLITREAAQVKANGGRADMISGMAKLFASEACAEIAGDALRIHGGYGYVADFPIERLYREAPLYIVGEGTNDIQKLVIARRIIEGQEAALLGLPQ
jgi:alkylation response protein AidB-like acyl-CoA dehydrogenase